MQNKSIVQGLRGISSLVVVIGHLTTSFAPEIHSPARSDNTGPSLFQFPFFRLCVGGRSAVAMFFLITGYVNSIGALSRTRAGNLDGAYSRLAQASLTRFLRLALPAAMASLIAWTLAQINAFAWTRHVDATWIRQGYIAPNQKGIFSAIHQLIRSVIRTWTAGWNDMEGTQWVLLMFLQASFMVYAILLAILPLRPKGRWIILLLIYLFGWFKENSESFMISLPFNYISNSLNIVKLAIKEAPAKNLNVIIGIFLATLQVELGNKSTKIIPSVISALLIILGLFFCGYPQDSPELTSWSRFLRDIIKPITPSTADLRRYWDSIGASLVLIGVFTCERARKTLSHRIFNFMGRTSFAVYLLHNLLMKTLLVWLVYFPNAFAQMRQSGSYINLIPFAHKPVPESMPNVLHRSSTLYTFSCIIVFFYFLYKISWLWTIYIDPLCNRCVKFFLRRIWCDPANTFELSMASSTANSSYFSSVSIHSNSTSTE